MALTKFKTNKEHNAETAEKLPELSKKKRKKLEKAKKKAKKNKKKKGLSLDDKILRKENAKRLRFSQKIERLQSAAQRGQVKIDKQIEKLKKKKDKAFDKPQRLAEKEFARRQKAEKANPVIKQNLKTDDGLKDLLKKAAKSKKK